LIRFLSGIAVIAIWVAFLAGEIFGARDIAAPLGAAGLAVYFLREARQFTRFAWFNVGGAAIAAAAVIVFTDHAGALLLQAARAATLLGALLTSMSLLREAARRSPMVHAAGRALVQQPPGRRYVALTFGGHLFGILFSYGSMTLLGTMVQAGNTLASNGGDADLMKRREKRMMLALLRGFQGQMLWAPTGVSIALILQTMPELTWPEIAMFGVPATIVFLLMGWAYDRATMPKKRPAVMVEEGVRLSAVLPMAALVAAIILAAIGLEYFFGGRLIAWIIAVAPVFGIGWIALQTPHELGRRLLLFFGDEIPAQRQELVVLTVASFVGVLIAALLPAESLRGALLTGAIPVWAAVLGVTWAVVIAGQLGFSPIISVTVIAALLPNPSRYGFSPVALAQAISCGWALTVGSSRSIAATLIIARLVGVPAPIIGRVWNRNFTLIGLAVASIYVVLLQLFTAP
jgi:hypothetical protein